MSEIVKHVGMITNTGKRCAIAFLQIPGKEDHALVVDTEALPERLHDPLMSIIKSSEGQQSQNLGEVLGRRMMPDSGNTMLTELHQLGYLQPQPVTNVTVVPRPNSKINLADMLEQMGRLDKEHLSQGVTNPNEVLAEKSDVFDNNRTLNNTEDQIETAKGLLTQADLLESDAKVMREKAYKMAPSLRPNIAAASETAKPKTRTTVKKENSSESKTTRTRSKNTGRKTASA